MAFADSKFVELWDQATVHVSRHGLHYGTGASEGVRYLQHAAEPG